MTEEQAREFLTVPDPRQGTVTAVYKHMYRVTFAILKDESEAEEAADTALFKAWRNRESYDQTRPATSFLNAIAKYTAIDRLRKMKKREHNRKMKKREHNIGSPGNNFTEAEIFLLLLDIEEALDSVLGARDLLIPELPERQARRKRGRPTNADREEKERVRKEEERVRDAIIAFLRRRGWKV